MKKVLILLGTVLLLGACHSANRVKIDGTIVGAANVLLEINRLGLSELFPTDTIITDARGNFSAKINVAKGLPEFYYITRNGKTLASLLLLAGDHISLVIDTTKQTTAVKGSIETEYLHEAEAGMMAARHRYDSLMQLFVAAEAGSKEAVELNYALGSVYIKQKQAAIRFLFSHPRSMASVQVLFQKFSDAHPLFGDFKDAPYFRHLYDSLQPLYPRSPYVAALKEQAELREQQMGLNEKLLQAQELGFPDINLPNTQAEPVALSSLQGKVIVLSFWLSQDPQQRMANQEFLDLYRKYASKGLEIYQVALDTDKTAWARTVAEQGLPWISVCDGHGVRSVAVSSYAVSQVPTNFLINKNGDIVGRDFSREQLAAEIAKLCK